jgi:hypothetical protein
MSIKSKGPWIGFDLDKTLAEYPPKNGESIGDPIPNVVARLRRYIAEGKECRIFTARVGSDKSTFELNQFKYDLDRWLRKHIGTTLEATCEKDHFMMELYDDRAKQVRPNTGEIIEDTLEMLKRYQKAKNV